MNGHLLLIVLGPVQDFIAQARRTRDFWFGSQLLSDLSGAAARKLAAGDARLIFPECATDKAVPNKLLAEVPNNVDPEQLAREVRDEVLRHWREDIAKPVKSKCSGLLAPNIGDVWDEQIGTFVEFLATWAPLDDGNYAAARHAVEFAMAGRKNLRDFGPWRHLRGGVPKSSLDGARETVLNEPRNRDADRARKYRISENEQLDAIALVKRAGGDPEQFVPVVNIALASWLDLANSVASKELGRLRTACEEAQISPVARPDLPCARPLQFDASVLLPSRWKSIFKEQKIAGDAQSWGRDNAGPLLAKLSEPYPYVACLVADGDRMGRALDLLGTKDGHREISRALSRFAARARRIVEQQHRGGLVYAGGDDVLAFLPVPEAVACADVLRRAFEDELAAAVAHLPEDRRPTLSAGIGIGHVMEGMGDLLRLGRDAEKEAKIDRNSLAVLVDMRSGGRRAWRCKWRQDPASALQRSVLHLDGSLSVRKVYEIASILRRLPAEAKEPAWATVLAREVERVLSRVGEGALTAIEVGLDLEGGYQELRAHVDRWVSRVLIARALARSVPRERRSRQKEAAA